MRFRIALAVLTFAVIVSGLLAHRIWLRDFGLDHYEHMTSARLPLVLPSTSAWKLVDAFPGLRFDRPVLILQAPRAPERFYVAEQGGRVWTFAADSKTREKTLFLDLSQQVRDRPKSEQGLLALAFHPDFGVAASENREFVYLWYTAKVNDQIYDRLSRFRVVPGELRADPVSETILVDQLDHNAMHNGGTLLFGSDGFLYFSVGDEGPNPDASENGQTISKDLFSGIFRIDVDRRGGTISHAPPRQPETGMTQGYYIPSDNPFVGMDGVLEEFWSLGLRNPWRMSLDPVTGDLWVGDVGAGRLEEINIATGGSNHQWSYAEGSSQMEGTHLGGKKPDPFVGIETPPVHEYTHDDGRSAVIGGYVYRGRKHPDLVGRYIYGDHGSGAIAALTWDGERVVSDEVIASLDQRGWQGLSSFGVDLAGEIYLLALGQSGQGRIMELVERDSGDTDPDLPKTLSGTGLFRNVSTLEVESGLLRYEINVSQWQDGASVEHWLALPAPDNARQKIVFSADESFGLPDGTILVQHFSLGTETARRNVETRILMRQAGGGVYGASYRWNAAGTEAQLVDETESETIVLGSRRKEWTYLGPGQCLTCHNTESGYVLGVNARQLNREISFPSGRRDNQLRTWEHLGLLRSQRYYVPPDVIGKLKREIINRSGVAAYKVPIAAFPDALLPRLHALDDEDSPLEERVAAYLDAQCAHCHRPGGRGIGEMDLRFSTPLDRKHLVGAPVLNRIIKGELEVVWPGEPEKSALYLRLQSDQLGIRMPQLQVGDRDERALERLREWIMSLE